MSLFNELLSFLRPSSQVSHPESNSVELLGKPSLSHTAPGYLVGQKYVVDPSFRLLMGLRTSRLELAGLGPEWKLNSKERAYRFVGKQGLLHPRVYQKNAQLSTLEPKTQCVVKPKEGANAQGVYLVLTLDKIYKPATRTWLKSWEEMLASMRKDLFEKKVKKDRWTIEELVTQDEESSVPGNDLKFYCFYGQVGLVLEVQRFQKLAYCEWNADGQPICSGKYKHKHFQGGGFTPDQKLLAEELSLKIPSPFIRIDFISSYAAPSGLVFGEFTPRPGKLHRFNGKTDRLLGEYFLNAEKRLENDFLARKKFDRIFSK